ncbi:MAG: hypothetical protein ACI39U_07895, partial [Candidatus Cryptobacteroides sp.]
MTVDSYSFQVCTRIFFRHLSDYLYVIVYGIVAQIAVAVGLIVASPDRAGTPMGEVEDYESQFGEHLVA